MERFVLPIVFHDFWSETSGVPRPYKNVCDLARLLRILEYCQKNDIVVMTCDEFVAQLKQGGLRLPPKIIVVSIDDGLKSFMPQARQAFLSFGFRATIFVIAKTLNGELTGTHRLKAIFEHFGGKARGERYRQAVKSNNPLKNGLIKIFAGKFGQTAFEFITKEDETTRVRLHFLTAQELKECASIGFEIGSHGFEHLYIGHMDKPAATEEIRNASVLITQCLNITPVGLAYPIGGPILLEVKYAAASYHGYARNYWFTAPPERSLFLYDLYDMPGFDQELLDEILGENFNK